MFGGSGGTESSHLRRGELLEAAALALVALLAPGVVTGCGGEPATPGDAGREEMPVPGGGSSPAESARRTELLAQAERQAAADDIEEAAATLELLLATDQDHIPALVPLGMIYSMEGRMGEAAEVYMRLAALRPGNGVYAMRAGSALEMVRRTQEAGPYLERAVRQRPRDPDAAYRLGLHQFNEGLFEEAATTLARGREVAPERPDMALKLAQALNSLARFTEALAVLDDTLARAPAEPLLTFQRGLLRNRSGDAAGAVADFRRVLELDPEQNRARYALARALAATGRAEEGQAVMADFAAQEEEERQRKTAQLVSGLARAGGDDDPVQNRLRLEELALSNPKNPEAHRLLAAAYAREGDYLQAAESYARAVRLDPEDAESARRRDELLRRLGQTVPPPAGPGP